jgi:hypothetical protein
MGDCATNVLKKLDFAYRLKKRGWYKASAPEIIIFGERSKSWK